MAKNIHVKSKALFACLVILLLGATDQLAQAKAYFASLKEMVERSEAIALADLGPVKSIKVKGQTWTYSLESQATLIETYKGKLPKSFTIRGGEDFRCAHVSLASGKNLIFLNKEGDYYRGANWMSSCIQVKDNKLAWFKTEDERHPQEENKVSLEQAIKDVKALVNGKSMGIKLPDYLKTLLNADDFTDHIIGEAPSESSQWIAYTRAKADSAKIKTELQYVASNGSPAGKLYAACALLSSDKKAGMDLLNSYKDQKVELLYRSGCRGTRETLGSISKSLAETGKFLNFSVEK
ncbi:hypothetical protein KA183_07495 [bacterium]|nr:hypothetical protein [bacterium]QQR58306.1 MAG: hypothetical protein IPG59_02090 [Candidatus Melainabacteria bacterium]